VRSEIATEPRGSSRALTAEQQVRVGAIVADLARAGETTAVEEFLDHGVSVDQQDESGNSLLMLAAYHGNLETVKALVRRGADPDLCNVRNQSPIVGALFKGEADIVTVLKAAGADLDIGTPCARDAARMFGQPL
jgi:ankyrin repeat protein